MSTFNRLFDLAAKALDKTGSSSSTPSTPAGQQAPADWRTMVRSAADSLTGEGQSRVAPSTTPPPAPGAPVSAPPAAHGYVGAATDSADRAAIARYDYLMRTADPQQIERIHQESFARLTPAQRAQVEARMRAELPPHEQPRSADPSDLARAAARTEAHQPGRMRRVLGRAGGTAAVAGAGVAAGGLLGMVAGGAALSVVAAPLLEQAAGFGVDFDALAQGVDLDALAEGVDVGGLTDGAGGLVDSAGEQLSGFGEQASGFGERLSELGIPGLGDLFGR